jgi:hypothetical protein
MIHSTLFVCVLALFAVSCLFSVADAKKKKNEPDPRDCEVCINNLNIIDSLLKPEEKSDKLAIRKAIGMLSHLICLPSLV